MAHCIIAVLVPATEPDPKKAAELVLHAQSATLLDHFYFVDPVEWFEGNEQHVSMVLAPEGLWSRHRWEQDHEGAHSMCDEDEGRLLATPGMIAVYANVHC